MAAVWPSPGPASAAPVTTRYRKSLAGPPECASDLRLGLSARTGLGGLPRGRRRTRQPGSGQPLRRAGHDLSWRRRQVDRSGSVPRAWEAGPGTTHQTRQPPITAPSVIAGYLRRPLNSPQMSPTVSLSGAHRDFHTNRFFFLCAVSIQN